VTSDRYRSKKTEHSITPQNNMTILIVEDNTSVLNSVKSIMKKYFSPCDFVTLNTCVDIDRSFDDIDLVLLDTSLNIDMHDCCDILRSKNCECPIIFMAVSEVHITQEQIIASGGDGIVYKPIEVDHMTKEINSVLDKYYEQKTHISSFHKRIN
jgi:DNA-binding response OmpR family regulator